MKLENRTYLSIAVFLMVVFISGCSPEVGSKAWCEDLNNKPKGDWTGNEASEYAKNCLFK